MDVTALLNENAAAVDQQQTTTEEILRLPTRNRMPWDAGGYSLPLKTSAAMKSPPIPYVREAIYLENDESHSTVPLSTRSIAATSTSPYHKLTDSRSSISSATSSILHSTCHSRYSSISTLNSPRSQSVSLPEKMLLSPKGVVEKESDSYFRIKTRIDGPEISSKRPLDTLAQIAERHSIEDMTSSCIEERGAIERRVSDPQLPHLASKQWRPSHHRSISSSGASHHSSLPILSIRTSIEPHQQLSSQGRTNREDGLGKRQINGLLKLLLTSHTMLISIQIYFVQVPQVILF